MEPTSRVLIVLVIVAVIALFVLLIRTGNVLVKTAAAATAFLLSVAVGVLAVNDYYGYYTTWGAAAADLSGNGNTYAVSHTATRVDSAGRSPGKLEVVDLRGARSGINREGLVYLPPQYFEPRYRDLRFPAIELFHGTPGDPAQWVNQMRITEIARLLIDTRRMGPVVLVMPDSNGGFSHQEECLDTPGFKDDTYVSQDVPADVRARFRVSRDTGQWGSIGVSSGGYCAANLMMRHRDDFGSAASIDGYYRPDQENAGPILARTPWLLRTNDPLSAAARARPGAGPLPAFWVSAGTGVRSDYLYAKQMVTAMRRLEAVPFLVLKRADHTMAAVRAALPTALMWSWQQLATPDEKREFPTAPLASGSTVYSAPIRHLLVTTHRRAHTPTFALGKKSLRHHRVGAEPRSAAPSGSARHVGSHPRPGRGLPSPMP